MRVLDSKKNEEILKRVQRRALIGVVGSFRTVSGRGHTGSGAPDNRTCKREA